MNSDSAENLNGPIKKFTRIMIFIAFGFVALYLFIFFQLKQTESQLTSYGNVTDSAIGNFLEKLPESNTIRVEKTVEGISFVVKGGEGSSLNADMLDGKDSSFFLNANNIQEGTLKNSTFSAWKNLEAEGITLGGKIKSEFLPTNSVASSGTINWLDIQNRPAGLDNGDDVGSLTETQVEEFISNGAINLSTGSTLNSSAIASQNWVSSQSYITGVNFSQITNASGVFLDYRPDNLACAQSQVLKYDAALSRWICGTDTGAGAITWGDVTGSLSAQTDLNTALNNKLGTTASFGGDVTGTYDAIVVTNDSHSHTGATISGLGTSNFTSANNSQWTNDSGFITNDTSVPKDNLANSGALSFTWSAAELASQVMVEGENISLLNNNAGFITGLNHSQVTNGAGIYLDYRPNNVPCDHDQTLKYDAALSRWACGNDNGAGTIAWGSITGTLSSQSDLSTALSSKLGVGASFGGDVSGTYDSIAISNDSHSHTGATITGLGATNFTSANISQWTNDAGFITGLDVSQVANGAGKYSNYKPNDVACTEGQVLKYDATNFRWLCGNDDSSGGGGSSVYSKWDPDAPPITASNLNDEFTTSSVDLAKWAEYDPNSLQVYSQDSRWLTLSQNNDAGDDVTGLYQTIPAGDFSISTKVYMQSGYKNYKYYGLALFENTSNGTSRIISHAMQVNDTHAQASVSLYTNASTWGSQYASVLTEGVTTAYLRIRRTGTTYGFDYSSDGVSWVLVYTGTLPFVPVAFGPEIINAANETVTAAYEFIRYTNVDVGNKGALTGREMAIGGGGGSSTVGSMTGTAVFANTSSDDQWLGLGAAAGRIEFDDQTVDEVNFLDANVGIGTATPQHRLDIAGNLGIAASGYLNFGTTDGTSGYGIRDNAGVIQAKNSAGTWGSLLTDAPSDGKNYVRKDSNWIEMPTADPSWSTSSIKWYVGSSEVTLAATSKQRYKINNGIVTIMARFISQSGVNLNGIFELRNLPVPPKNSVDWQVVGSGEWTDEMTNYYSIRAVISDFTNGYIGFKRYDTYQKLSGTVNGNEGDAISVLLTYETDQAGSLDAANFSEQVTVPVLFPITSSGTWTKGVDTNLFTNSYLVNAAQNDYAEWGIPLGAGTWKLELIGQKGTNRGIGTVTLDGASLGTIDQYNGSLTNNDLFTINSIAVASSGNKRLRVTVSGKNATSSAYLFPVSMIVLSKQ